MARGDRAVLEPFEGDPADVQPGDRVWCRTTFNTWVERVALTVPRYDRPNATGGRCWLTVRTRAVDDETDEGWNWPAGDVRTEAPRGWLSPT